MSRKINANISYLKKPYDMRVHFKTNLVEIKPPTKTYYDDETQEAWNIEEAHIRACTTLDEIDEQSDFLLEQLRALKVKKIQLGYDVSGEMDNLKRKLELVKYMKEKILKKIKNAPVAPRHG